MRPITVATIAFAATAASLLATHTGQAPGDLTEYDAVYADGPYSHLPPQQSWQDAAATAPEVVTEAEAMATGQFLDMLAGEPNIPTEPQAPLDRRPISGTGLQMAGL